MPVFVTGLFDRGAALLLRVARGPGVGASPAGQINVPGALASRANDRGVAPCQAGRVGAITSVPGVPIGGVGGPFFAFAHAAYIVTSFAKASVRPHPSDETDERGVKASKIMIFFSKNEPNF